MKYTQDNYDKMITSIKNEMSSATNVDADVDIDSMTKILNELGIRSASGNEFKLILWNDHINDMISVLIALFEVCKLDNEQCMSIMMEAHEKGRAVVKTGDFDELNVLKTGLNDRNLEATIEEI